MAVELASAYVSIIPTTKGIAASLEKELVGPVNQAAKKAGDEAGATMKKSLDKTSASFTKFGVGALAVAGVVGAGLFKVGQSASDLGESVNAVKVTFGNAADGILKLGEDAAKSVGLSNSAFNGLAVQFSSFATTIAGKGGDVSKTIGEMTGRAADFASVMNIDVAEAARIFQSGLAGETEPLKKFGIDLSAAAVNAFAAANGIGTLGSELTESEKVTARYGLLMESTAKTQGDFANTSDSAANATRIAKAELENASASLGAAFTPAIAFAAGAVADLAGKFVGLNDATGGWLAKGAGIAALALGAAGGISLIVGQAIKMHDRFTALSGAVSTFKDKISAMSTAGKVAFGAVGIAAGLALFAITTHLQNVERSNAFKRARVDEFTAALKDGKSAAEAYDAALTDAGRIEFVDAGEDVKDLTGALARAGISFEEFKTHLASQAEFDAWVQEIGLVIGAGDDLNHLIQGGTQLMAAMAKATQDAADQAKVHGTSLDGERHALDQSGVATGNLELSEEGLAAATQLAKDKADAFAQSLVNQREKTEDLYGKEYDAIQAKHDLADATTQAEADVAAMTETLKKHKAGTEEATAATDTAYDSIVNVAEQYGTLNGAALGSDSSIRRQIDSLKLQASTMAPGSDLRVRLENYIAELESIPSKVATTVSLNISVGQVATAAGDIIGMGTVSFAGEFKPRARGGPSSGRILVGEDGPEFLDVPPGSFVHTAQATRAMQSATSTLGAVSGNAPLIGEFNNYRRDPTVGELNQILAMARLAA